MLQALSIANTPSRSVRAKMHQTILFRFHFWISVVIIVIRFPPFMVPIIKRKPCHNLAEIKFFQIINSIFSFRGVRGCSGSYCCEKIQQIQGFSICRAVNRLLWLAVPARSGVNGFILGRVDFLLIFPPHQHQRQQVHPRRGIYTPLKVPRE